MASSDKELELDITEGNIGFEEKLQVGGKGKRRKARYDILMSWFVCLFQTVAMYLLPWFGDGYFLLLVEARNAKS